MSFIRRSLVHSFEDLQIKRQDGRARFWSAQDDTHFLVKSNHITFATKNFILDFIKTENGLRNMGSGPLIFSHSSFYFECMSKKTERYVEIEIEPACCEFITYFLL